MMIEESSVRVDGGREMKELVQTYAKFLDGVEYGQETARLKPALDEMKQDGIVVVYGESDDLVEFDGAICDEAGAWGGTTVYVNQIGLFPDPPCENAIGFCAYFRNCIKGCKTIQALWCAEDGYAWTFKTDIPHATFDVLEDGKPYCRGIVFALSDVGGEKREEQNNGTN